MHAKLLLILRLNWFVCCSSSFQTQYIFLHNAILDGITSVWTDIPVEELPKRMCEMSEENDDGDTGYAVEFYVRPCSNFMPVRTHIQYSTVHTTCWDILILLILTAAESSSS